MNSSGPGAAALNVSRETYERIEVYAELLKKWNPRINLVAKSTLADLWDRHILDSLQVWRFRPEIHENWVDLGSGGGFPGLLISLLENAPNITLIESDQRKCAFLRTVLRETGIKAKVLAKRIEAAPAQNANVLSARALADLSTLLGFANQHLKPDGVALFPKGATWEKEVEKALESWSFTFEVRKSETEPKAVILKIGELARV